MGPSEMGPFTHMIKDWPDFYNWSMWMNCDAVNKTAVCCVRSYSKALLTTERPAHIRSFGIGKDL